MGTSMRLSPSALGKKGVFGPELGVELVEYKLKYFCRISNITDFIFSH